MKTYKLKFSTCETSYLDADGYEDDGIKVHFYRDDCDRDADRAPVTIAEYPARFLRGISEHDFTPVHPPHDERHIFTSVQ